MHPTMAGTLTSGKSPYTQLLPIVCWIVLSKLSRTAAKQQITRPKISRSTVLCPQY